MKYEDGILVNDSVPDEYAWQDLIRKEKKRLLSSMHFQDDINLKRNKPEISMFHNSSKGEINTFDQRGKRENGMVSCTLGLESINNDF